MQPSTINQWIIQCYSTYKYQRPQQHIYTFYNFWCHHIKICNPSLRIHYCSFCKTISSNWKSEIANNTKYKHTTYFLRFFRAKYIFYEFWQHIYWYFIIKILHTIIIMQNFYYSKIFILSQKYINQNLENVI